MEASSPGSKKKKTGGGSFPPVDTSDVKVSETADTAMAIRGKPAHSEDAPTKGSEGTGGGSSGGPGRSLDPIAGLKQLNENLKDLNRVLDPTPPGHYWIGPSAPSIYKDLGHGAKILGDEGKRGIKNIREEAGRTWENVKDEAGRAIKNTSEELGRAPENLADMMQGKDLGGKQFHENVKAGLETLKENVDAGIKKIDEGMGWEWENQKKHLKSNIKDAGEGIGGSSTKALEDSVAEAGRAWQNLGDEVKRVPGNLDHVPTGTDVSKGIEKLKENAQAGVDRLNENLHGFNQVLDPDGDSQHWVTPNMPEIYGEIKQGYKDVEAEANRVPGNIRQAGQEAAKEIERVPGNVQKMLGTDKIRDEVTAPTAKAIEQEYKRGLDQLGKFEDKAGAEIGKALDQGAKQIEGVGKKAGQWLDKTADKAGSGILKGAKQLEDAGKKLGGAVGRAGKEVGDAIGGAAGQVGDALGDAQDAAQGVVSGAQDAAEDGAEQGQNAAEEGCDAVAGVFGGNC